MSDPRPPPAATGARNAQPTAPTRYVMTYEGIELPPTSGEEGCDSGSDDVRQATEEAFNRWLLEWMLAWTTDPNVMRVDSDPNEEGEDGRLVVEIDRSTVDQATIGGSWCELGGRHRRLVRELDRRVANLIVRCEPPTRERESTDVDRCEQVEVYG